MLSRSAVKPMAAMRPRMLAVPGGVGAVVSEEADTIPIR